MRLRCAPSIDWIEVFSDFTKRIARTMYALHHVTRDPRPLGMALAARTRAPGNGFDSQLPSRLQPASTACNGARSEASLDRPRGQPGHSRRFTT
jgi:hypothetical protein